MIAKSHILYIDITTECGLGCEFCMYSSYSENGKKLSLSEYGYKQLANLINHPDVHHIIISGEGEPFRAVDILLEVLRLSEGGNYFQIVTNGYWVKNPSILDKIVTIISDDGDTLSLRFSLDSFHWKILGKGIYQRILSFPALYTSSRLTFAFRSLLEERVETRNYISNIIGLNPVATSELDDCIYLNGSEINITYKNTVFPKENTSGVSLFDYINLLSSKYNKPFTFGNLSTDCSRPGLDITIKPSGEVYFYGVDKKSYCNLNFDRVCVDRLRELVEKTPILNVLYCKPLNELLRTLDSSEVSKLIESVNNPYWLIKSLPDKYMIKLEKLYEEN